MIAPKGAAAGVTCATASPTFTTKLTVDAFGAPLTVTDPLGHVTTRVYDANHQLTSLTDPDGHVTGSDYDPAGQVVTVHRADGTTLANGYDADGAQTSQTDGAGHTASYAHADPAFPQAVTGSTDPLGRTTGFGYDLLGQKVTKQDPGGNCGASPKVGCTTLAYDAAGQVSGIDYSDPATHDVTYGYDTDGRLTSETNGAGTTVSYGYDLAGHVTSILYPRASAGRVTRAYDNAGHLQSVTDWLGHTTSYGYDADSNLASQADPNGKTATITTNAADQLTGISHAPTSAPSSPFASFSYGRDNNGQETSVTSTGVPADSHSYSYSQLNQLGNVDTSTTAYGYDAADNLVRLANGNAQYFDAANELTATTPAITLVGTASGGDAGTSSSTTITLPAGIVANDQILVAVTTEDTNTVTTPTGYLLVAAFPGPNNTANVYRRTATGGETSVTLSFSSGLGTAKSAVAAVYRGVDPTNPIDGISWGSSAGSPSGLDSTVTVPSLTTTAANDRLLLFQGANENFVPETWNPPSGMTDRVHKSDLPLSSSALADQTLGAAGPTGPRTATITPGSSAADSCFLDAALVALKPAATIYGYDGRGNRTSITPPTGSATTLAYDQANRLTAFGTAGSYGYDGDGLRMTKTVAGTTTRFAWDTAQGLPVLIGEGTKSYVYGPGGQPLEQITPLTISLVGTASAGDAGTATSTTVTLPAGITVNDQILVAITTQSDLTVTTPSGYTVVGTYPAGTASKTIVYRRTAAGSETSVTLSYSGLRQKSIVAAVYRGVDPTNPIDVSSSASAVNATSVTAPSVTTTAVNDRLVLFGGANGNALPVTWNAPAGMTDQVHYSGLPLSAAALADQTLGAAGATGTRTATTSSTPSSLADLTAVMLALRPDQVVFYYHQDQLGSTRALTDRAGAVVATYTYDPYGNLTASTGTVTTPFG